MLAPNIAAVDLALLKMVCESAWSESSTLEFKRDAPGNADKDKHELLKDVCALANADGGDIVFGIDEVDGVASTLVPISSEPADALVRRINQTVESGIEPRLLGLQITKVDAESSYLLVVRVPASYLGPHSIKVNNSRRFVMRNGTNTSDLSFDQLRMAFDRTASLGERARAFVRERNRALESRTTPKRLIFGPIRAVHFVPLGGLAGKQAPDLKAMHNQTYMRLLEGEWGGGSRVFNLDGLVVYPSGSDDGHDGYAQIFRTGAMESASLAGSSYQEHQSLPERLFVWSLGMSNYFRERTETFLALARDLGQTGPAIVSFSMLHVGQFELAVDSRHSPRGGYMPDRDHLVAPEVWVDNLETANVDEIVRPLLDTLWQGFGVERCLDYDAKTGQYMPRNRSR